MLKLMNLSSENLTWVKADASDVLKQLSVGHEFNAPELLFSKISAEQVEELAIRYKEKKEV